MKGFMDGIFGGTRRVFETPVLAAAIYAAALVGVPLQMALDDGKG
jgi:hypothetical protein